ncbi:MAG: hypothetical protein ACOZBZ_01380 [Patescibacteria group bacterium]
MGYISNIFQFLLRYSKIIHKIPKNKRDENKKFTILHPNDMHGDFLAEVKALRQGFDGELSRTAQGKQGELIGGLALLSGYINIW